MIPKLIHQIYLGFDGPIEDKPLFMKSKNDIQTIMPDWEYKLWSLEDIRSLIKSSPKTAPLIDFFDNLRWPIQKCDLGRYIILWNKGGFYIDCDIIVSKRFDDLLDNELLFYNYEKNDRKFEIDFMASNKNNPFWLQIINHCIIDYKEKSKKKIYHTWKARFVMQTTGPYFFDRAIKKINPSMTKMDLIKSIDSNGDYAFNHRSHTWDKK